MKGVQGGNDLQHRPLSCTPVPGRVIAADAIHLHPQCARVPAGQPDRCVVVGGEKSQTQRGQSLVVGKRKVTCPHRRRVDFRGNGFSCRRGQDDGRDLLGAIHRSRPGDEVAEGMAEHDSSAIGQRSDHCGDVVGHVFEVHAVHRPHRSGHSAGLGPQHPETGADECRSSGVVVLTAVATVGRNDDHRRTMAGDVGLDRCGTGVDDLATPDMRISPRHARQPPSAAATNTTRSALSATRPPTVSMMSPPTQSCSLTFCTNMNDRRRRWWACSWST